MSPDYPAADEPATPGWVLAVLRQLDPDLTGDLKPGDSISTLLSCTHDHCWPTTRVLAESLNAVFRLELPLAKWQRQFPTIRRRTGRELCEFLATRVRRPVVRPWRHASGDCLPAGAFLSVRSALARAGVDPAAVTPAAPLAPVLRTHAGALLHELTLLAPDRVPEYVADRSLERAGGVSLAVGLLGLTVGWALGRCGLAGAGAALLGLGCAGLAGGSLLVVVASCRPPRRAALGSLVTFRDLAYHLAGQRPRRRLQPTP